MKTTTPVNTKLVISRVSTLCLSCLLLVGINGCGGSGDSSPFVGSPDKTISLSNFQSASIVIGQADFVGNSKNQGGSTDANTFGLSYSTAAFNDSVMYLADFDNNRVLGFNKIPEVSNQPADFVIGQTDFTSSDPSISATSLRIPIGVSIDKNKMAIVDFDANRILIWDNIPTTPDSPADVVLGQIDFVSDQSSCTASGLDQPIAATILNNKMYVVDFQNNRVLIWNSIPTQNNTPADVVLGQQSFTNCASNDTDDDGTTDTASASTLNQPTGLWTDGNRLVISDSENNRALIWNTIPTTNFATADIVLGQSDFTQTTANDDDQNNIEDIASARTMQLPILGVYSNGTQLFISDSFNYRILIWDSFPTQNFAPADKVLGQSNFTLTAANDDDQDGVKDTASARTFNFPSGIFQSDNQLIVGDSFNYRYLIFNGE